MDGGISVFGKRLRWELVATVVYSAAVVLLPAAIAQDEPDKSLDLITRVLDREKQFHDIRGFVDHPVYRSQARVDLLQSLVDGRAGQGDWYPYDVGEWTRHMARFLIADEKARWEAVAIKNGPNVWGLDPALDARLWLRTPVQDDPLLGDRLRAIVVRDGRRELSYVNALGMGTVRPQDHVVPAVRQPPFAWLLGFGYLTETYGERLKRLYDAANAGDDKAEDLSFAYVGEDAVGEVVCHKLVFTADRPTSASVTETWVSEDYGYAVVQMRRRVDMKDPKQTGDGSLFTSSGYREVAPGLWLPHRVVRQEYKYNPNIDEPWRETEAATFYDLRANVGTTEADFQYEFPLGTFIGDQQKLYQSSVPADIRSVAGRESTAGPPREDPPPLDPFLTGK